ncbi:hypothetical protein Poly51_22520 [Rubripirellula tenax]|uniref:Uncharacterized protein n=1 Tax=Rubripirellula tenax TaxID=2528015 RepID=A0A5C6FH19_9BACT|nr:hypothetical protein Poly51_22520 [Rubripirellula tenax]
MVRDEHAPYLTTNPADGGLSAWPAQASMGVVPGDRNDR